MPENYAVVTIETESLTIHNESKDIARMTANMNTWKLPKKCLQNFLNILDSHVYLKTDKVDGFENVYINPNNKTDDVLLISEYVEFSKLIEPFKKTASEKKYEGGNTKKFISLFNGKEDGLTVKDYYSCSVLAVSTEGNTEWNLLLDFRKLYEMDDGVVRPTRSGITLSEKLSRDVISNIKNMKEIVNNFPKSAKRKSQDDHDNTAAKKQCEETYQEYRDMLLKIKNMINELNL